MNTYAIGLLIVGVAVSNCKYLEYLCMVRSKMWKSRKQQQQINELPFEN